EARAALAAVHGVPNDGRLPYAALSELRALIFMRLVQLAKQEADNQRPLTSLEHQAVDSFKQLVINRRVANAQKALDQYDTWKNDPCHYVVPPGFGFDAYEPGPQCGVGGVMLAGPPRPPTANQFSAYGAAL